MNSLLIEALASQLVSDLQSVALGHCVRIDEIDLADAAPLARGILQQRSDLEVHVLNHQDSKLGIRIDQAVEIRNLKRSVFVLIVPFGSGDGAGSLENSFQRYRLQTLLDRAASQLLDGFSDVEARHALMELKRSLGRVESEGWARLVSNAIESENREVLCESLWLVGLIPDFWDEHFIDRIRPNIRCVSAVARPKTLTAPLSARFDIAGLIQLEFRSQLSSFLTRTDVDISNARLWTRLIQKDALEHFYFRNWKMGSQQDSPIRSIEAVSFRKNDGSLRAATKLKLDPDNQQPFIEVSEEHAGVLVLEWKTDPKETAVVDKWELALLPPNDLRDGDDLPIRTSFVVGSKRKATFKINLDQQDLESDSRFIVRISGFDELGQPLSLTNGEDASVECEEFDVRWVDEIPERQPRRSNAQNVYLARLEAVVQSGLIGKETISLDIDGKVLIFSPEKGASRQIRFSRVILDIQRQILNDKDKPLSFLMDRTEHFDHTLSEVKSQFLNISKELRSARQNFLTILGTPHFIMTEAVVWTKELRSALASYVDAYTAELRAVDEGTSSDVLRLDVLEVIIRSDHKDVRCAVATPLHPLRLAWLSEYELLFSSWQEELTTLKDLAVRQGSIELSLLPSISPKNLPFLLLASDNSRLAYSEELVFGCGLYLPINQTNYEGLSQEVCAALGLDRQSQSVIERSQQIEKRAAAYMLAHPEKNAYGILAVNAGTGESILGSVRTLLGVTESEDEVNQVKNRVFVTVYADQIAFNSPLEGIQELQRELQQSQMASTNYLAGPLTLRRAPVENLTLEDDAVHISIVQDSSVLSEFRTEKISERSVLLGGLLTPLVTEYNEELSVFVSAPALMSEGSSVIPVMHRAHQECLARVDDGSGILLLQTDISPDAIDQLRVVHEKSDWVITLDRFLGPDIFELGSEIGLGSNYVLDYSPDFVDGFGDKITVTTKHRSELNSILTEAMLDLGLASVGTETTVVDNLNAISGRLVLKLLGNLTQAREAVGLAATMLHIRRIGQLENKIVIPVDSHDEIFGVASRNGEEGTRRCDLLLVELGESSIMIEFVEVKTRQTLNQLDALTDRIREQLRQSQMTLLNRIQSQGSGSRVDIDVQRAHFFSILHYYAERGIRSGNIDSLTAQTMHSRIDSLIEKGEIETSLTGYVVCPEAEETSELENAGALIMVLGERELGLAGFTTQRELTLRATGERNTSGLEEFISAVPKSSKDGEPDERTKARTQSAPLVPLQPATRNEELKPSAALTQPGSKARSVEVSLGVDKHGTVGTWNISTTGSPHALIVGIPGQGKSVTTRQIIRECESKGLPSVIFDFHGDMRDGLKDTARIIDVTAGLPFGPFEQVGFTKAEINGNALEVAEIIAYVCDLGDIQQNHVYEAIKLSYQQCGWLGEGPGDRTPTVPDFVRALEKVEAAKKGKNAMARLTPLTDFGLFDHADGGIDFLSRTTVIDMSRLALEGVQKAATAFVLRKIYKEMLKAGPADGMQLMVVLDEAHRSAKDATLPKLMKEGRKFGIGVIVASQQISDFNTNLLGNVGLKIAFRTNFPDSKKVAGMFVDRSGRDVSGSIESLGVGEAFVSIPPKGAPLRLSMNQ